jgi:rRNA-processing protein FCF1
MSRGAYMATKVILDTNAVLMPFQFGINLNKELERLLGECEILVPMSVLEELKDLKPKRLARAAQELALKFKVFETTEKGDKAIISVAKELKCPVVTNDKKLIKTLEKLGLPVIFLRSRSHLVLSGRFL